MVAAILGIRPIAMLITGDFIYRGVDITPEFPYTIALGLLGTGTFVTAGDDQRLLLAAATWAVSVPIIFRAGFMPGLQWWLYFLVPCLLGVVVSTRTQRPREPLISRPLTE